MSALEDITFFSAVDRTNEPAFFRRCSEEGNKLPDIISSKPPILAGLQLTGGEKLLDLGSGLGDDTFAIARLVGSQGRVVGARLPRLFKQHAMTDARVSPQTIFISYPFREILLGGHLARAGRRGWPQPRRLNDGGPTHARRTKAAPSFMHSPR
jgi:hypothetical protein